MNTATSILSRDVLRHGLRSGKRPATSNVLPSATNAPRRRLHRPVRTTTLSASSSLRRPTVRPTGAFPSSSFQPRFIDGARTIFIQTESTPNLDVSGEKYFLDLSRTWLIVPRVGKALKFLPNCRVLPENLATTFLEYLSPRSTLAPPHPSPLAARLLSVDGVAAVFYGPDFITVTKSTDTNWAHVKPEIFSLITEVVSSGDLIVQTSQDVSASTGQAGAEEQDDVRYNEADREVVSMIRELLETRIRPAIQEDGGDIEFRGFDHGQVFLKLRGACRTCDSSTVTLRNGIESMLKHYIEEVQGVQQVLDPEEEVAEQEFARFEEKLRQTRGPTVVA